MTKRWDTHTSAVATLSSCGYVYLAVYPTPETKK
ncbi:type IV toxin-antitoxin system YeeU family antitoxin [Escherichia coli]|nr:type IV toxin-antitoxin system YeeU family antitoxin [Escherichia coli]